MQIEGRDAQGVHFAMDYLTSVTRSVLDSNFQDGQFINTERKNVIVIGGGDAGADCIATALRQKCNSVIQFSKHPKLPMERTADNMWPSYPNVYTLDYAHKEAKTIFGTDPREYLIQTKKIEKDANGHVKALHTVQMEKIYHEDGSYHFNELPGTESVWPADYVFIAIGFEGTETSLADQFGVETVNHKIKASVGKYQTNVEGVFVCGDARRGQSLIVWAITEGRAVARMVDYYLKTVAV